jgi:hypothetical protein
MQKNHWLLPRIIKEVRAQLTRREALHRSYPTAGFTHSQNTSPQASTAIICKLLNQKLAKQSPASPLPLKQFIWAGMFLL